MSPYTGLLEPEYDEMNAQDMLSMADDLAASLDVAVEAVEPPPAGDMNFVGIGRPQHLIGSAAELPPEALTAAMQGTAQQGYDAITRASVEDDTATGGALAGEEPPLSGDDLNLTSPEEAQSQVSAILQNLDD